MSINDAGVESESKPKPIKYQVYLGDELQEALEKYIRDNYAPRTQVKTAVIRKAVMEFLKKEGYYSSIGGSSHEEDNAKMAEEEA